jgi:hypothetical protein
MNIKKISAYTITPVLILGLIYMIGSLFIGTHVFIDPKKVNGFVDPDTIRIDRKGKNFFVTSGFIRTAKGNEGCPMAKEMAKKGFKITKGLLKNAKVIRLEPFGGKEGGAYSARIFIDEVRLGKALLDAGAAIKYEKGINVCGNVVSKQKNRS